MHKIVLSLVFASSAASAPPKSSPVIQTKYNPGELITQCRSAIVDAKNKLDAIVAIPVDRRTIENTLLARDGVLAEYSDRVSPLQIMNAVSPIEALRNESDTCETESDQFENAVKTRRDLFDAVKDAKPRDAFEARVVETTLDQGRENGMTLVEADRAEFRRLLDEKAMMEQRFNINVRDDKTRVAFTAEELEGVAERYLKKQPRDEQGRYLVGVGDTDFREILLFAKKGDTRRRYLIVANQRGGRANIELLQKTLGHRERLAKMVGFANWSDLKTSTRMAKSGAKVEAFLDDLHARLREAYAKEKLALLELKKATEPGATELEAWDRPFYAEMLRKQTFNLDRNELREYFPAQTVVPGMLSIYAELLGLEFREVANADVWAPEVKLIEVRNRVDDRMIGSFYMDLYERDGKRSSGAFCARLRIGVPYGAAMVAPRPIAIIVANLERGTADTPALLTQDEMQTLFHEFGHVMADLLTNVRTLTAVPLRRDFVEAPSQMLENWVWQPEVLTRLSGHYQDPAKKIPEDLLRRVLPTRTFLQARGYLGQLILSRFDLRAHRLPTPVDVVALYDRIAEDLTGNPPMPNSLAPASITHVMGGYDAGYYGYLWSKVYAQDMFSVFKQGGVFDRDLGARYRKYILEPADSEDPEVLLEKFLGRKASPDAFFRELGVQ